MSDVRVAVLFGFGINCDHETAAVFRLVGAEADRLHVNRLIESPEVLATSFWLWVHSVIMECSYGNSKDYFMLSE